MDLIDDIAAEDGRTARDASGPWAFADDAFLEQMLDAPAASDAQAGLQAAFEALSEPPAYAVETLEQARDRIADILAGFDDELLAPAPRFDPPAFADPRPFAAARVDAPANDDLLALPAFDDALTPLGLTQDDFIFPWGDDDRLVLPGETGMERFYYQATHPGEAALQAAFAVPADASLGVADQGHPWLLHDDWLF